jgi:hypothetical protein
VPNPTTQTTTISIQNRAMLSTVAWRRWVNTPRLAQYRAMATAIMAAPVTAPMNPLRVKKIDP